MKNENLRRSGNPRTRWHAEYWNAYERRHAVTVYVKVFREIFMNVFYYRNDMRVRARTRTHACTQVCNMRGAETDRTEFAAPRSSLITTRGHETGRVPLFSRRGPMRVHTRVISQCTATELFTCLDKQFVIRMDVDTQRRIGIGWLG